MVPLPTLGLSRMMDGTLTMERGASLLVSPKAHPAVASPNRHLPARTQSARLLMQQLDRTPGAGAVRFTPAGPNGEKSNGGDITFHRG